MSKKKETAVAKIHVLHDWGGVPSNFQRIAPGEYSFGDPALLGLEDYLITNGHAVRIGVLVQEDEPETPPNDNPPTSTGNEPPKQEA